MLLLRAGVVLAVTVMLVSCSMFSTAPSRFTITFDPSADPGAPQIRCPPTTQIINVDNPDIVARLLPEIAVELLKDSSDEYRNFQVNSVMKATEAGLHGSFVANWCGEEVYQATWIGRLIFPEMAPSNSGYSLLIYMTPLRDEWHVWATY